VDEKIITLTRTITYTFDERDRDEVLEAFNNEIERTLSSGRKITKTSKYTETSFLILELKFKPKYEPPEVIYAGDGLHQEKVDGATFIFNERFADIHWENMKKARREGKDIFGI
jgi:hypothetical protein